MNIPFAGLPFSQRVVGAFDGMGIFFCLSGFLIGGILFDTVGVSNQLEVFYVRRFFRIIPLYWILLLSFVVMRAIDNHWRLGLIGFLYADIPLWHYLVFTQNNTTTVYGALWLVVTWSLAVEEQFYLLVPWLVRFLSRRLLLIGVLATLLLCPFLRWLNPTADRVLLASSDRLMAGVLVAMAVRHDGWRTRLHRYRGWLGAGLAVFFATTMVLSDWLESVPLRTNLSVPVYAVLVYYVWSAPVGGRVERILKRVAPVGLGSYFIYLFHLPVAYFLTLWFDYSKFGMVLVPPVVVALLAWLSYRFLESPLIRVGRKFLYKEIPSARTL